MVGADVIGITPEYGLEYSDNLFSAFTGLAVFCPELPGMNVHQAVGVERGRVEIIGIGAMKDAHGICVFLAQSLVIGLRFDREALRQRSDIGALTGALRTELLRLL